MPNHPYTPSPSELPGLLSGEVTEVWVAPEEPIEDWQMCLGFPVKHDDRGKLVPIDSPYAVGDVLVVMEEWYFDWERDRTHYKNDMDENGTTPYLCSGDGGLGGGVGNANITDWQPADTMPHWASRLSLTITAVTPQQRDGVWGFAYEVVREAQK